MTENRRRQLNLQLDRLIAALPADIANAATADCHVLTARIPERHRANAERLRGIVHCLANDNG